MTLLLITPQFKNSLARLPIRARRYKYTSTSMTTGISAAARIDESVTNEINNNINDEIGNNSARNPVMQSDEEENTSDYSNSLAPSGQNSNLELIGGFSAGKAQRKRVSNKINNNSILDTKFGASSSRRDPDNNNNGSSGEEESLGSKQEDYEADIDCDNESTKPKNVNDNEVMAKPIRVGV